MIWETLRTCETSVRHTIFIPPFNVRPVDLWICWSCEWRDEHKSNMQSSNLSIIIIIIKARINDIDFEWVIEISVKRHLQANAPWSELPPYTHTVYTIHHDYTMHKYTHETHASTKRPYCILSTAQQYGARWSRDRALFTTQTIYNSSHIYFATCFYISCSIHAHNTHIMVMCSRA